ncbi:archaemetzincin family Zn-dependent metalloprotease [Nitratiruptor tergarcus]|uniref:Archaemetzincin n=1 Tax=Nitratiruptor tergarcus DSM 16512 TaxID=1069081 RepID=A0A1W1WUC1_9BACT|nr:archaemetzincin family Zn-dependent metalloprotease [Nitratiruptor tergarcus]SMC09911.1 archaemetzincin [Nitratiruptor tergarcus DSM 16512]
MRECNFKSIKIVNFDWKDKEGLAFLLVKLQEIFRIPVTIGPQASLPHNAFNVLRKQYLASSFLETLLLYKQDKEIVLGVTAQDIYEPNLNFVFGVATPIYAVALISTARLHNSFYGLPEDRNLFLKRVITEAVHEIGHTLGLKHCPNPHCVMHFSNTLADTDAKRYNFCSQCWKKVEKALCLT